MLSANELFHLVILYVREFHSASLFHTYVPQNIQHNYLFSEFKRPQSYTLDYLLMNSKSQYEAE